MDADMKIAAELVRKMREEKSWSQEHLAEVSGLSLRTVQRVEGEGAASPETKMAIASALGITSAELTPRSDVVMVPTSSRISGLVWGYTGVAVGTLMASAGAIFGQNSAFESGVALGVIGLVSGLSCSGIGLLARRA